MNAPAKIEAPSILSRKAIAEMTRVDLEHENWCKRKGYMKAGECHGFRAVFRSIKHGGIWDDARIYRTRAEALEAAHNAIIPNHVFERVERVNTGLHSVYEGEDYFTTPRVSHGMGDPA